MVGPCEYRIMENGSGWYWEVVASNREVLARGVAETQAEARTQAQAAQLASQRLSRIEQQTLTFQSMSVG